MKHILRGILRVHMGSDFCPAVIVNSRSVNRVIQAAGSELEKFKWIVDS